MMAQKKEICGAEWLDMIECGGALVTLVALVATQGQIFTLLQDRDAVGTVEVFVFNRINGRLESGFGMRVSARCSALPASAR
jgi:hypothetical protein